MHICIEAEAFDSIQNSAMQPLGTRSAIAATISFASSCSFLRASSLFEAIAVVVLDGDFCVFGDFFGDSSFLFLSGALGVVGGVFSVVGDRFGDAASFFVDDADVIVGCFVAVFGDLLGDA